MRDVFVIVKAVAVNRKPLFPDRFPIETVALQDFYGGFLEGKV
jgi:hypothetical protein